MDVKQIFVKIKKDKIVKTPPKASTNNTIDLSLNNDTIKNNSIIKNNNISDNYMNEKYTGLNLKNFLTRDDTVKWSQIFWNKNKKTDVIAALAEDFEKQDGTASGKVLQRYHAMTRKYREENYIAGFRYDLVNSDFICLDFDYGEGKLDEIFEEFPFLTPNTYRTTGRSGRGFHFYCRSKFVEDYRCDKDGVTPKPKTIDFKKYIYEGGRAFTELYGNEFTVLSLDDIKKVYPTFITKEEKIEQDVDKLPYDTQQKVYEFCNEELIEMLDILKPKRYIETTDWRGILYSLKSKNLKDVARKFSQKEDGKHYDEAGFEAAWNSHDESGNIGIIVNFAKKDNLKEFNKIRKKYKIIETRKKYNRDDDFIDYAQQKIIFEKKHFLTLFPKLQFCFENENENGLCDIQTYTSETNFKAYSSMFSYNIEIEKKDGVVEVQEKPFYPSWIKDKHRRQYSSMVFKPYPEKTNLLEYNTFKGFNYEKYEPEEDNFAIYQNHLKYLCGDDKTDDLFNYMEQWIANIIFRPAELNKVSIIIKSEYKQIGKGLFFRKLFSNILYKEAFLETVKADDVFGKFANTYKRFVVVLDEAELKETFELEAAIKHYITEPVIMAEKKGIDKQKVDNYARLMLFTNKTALKIEADDERFIAIEITEKRKNKEYYDNLSNALDNKNQLAGYVKYLYTIFDENYDFQYNRPLTIYYEELQGLSLPIWFRFWFDYLKDKDKIKFDFQSYDFYINEYCVWMQKHSFKATTIQKYGRDLTKIPGITKKTDSKFAVYTVMVDILLKGFVEKKYINDEICCEILDKYNTDCLIEMDENPPIVDKVDFFKKILL